MIFWTSEPKIFPQMVGLDVDESHGIPIRKQITKKKHKSKWYEGILNTLIAPFIAPSHSHQPVSHSQETPIKSKRNDGRPRLRQGRQNAHFPNPEKNPHHTGHRWSAWGTFPDFRVSPPNKQNDQIKLDVQLNPYAMSTHIYHTFWPLR